MDAWRNSYHTHHHDVTDNIAVRFGEESRSWHQAACSGGIMGFVLSFLTMTLKLHFASGCPKTITTLSLNLDYSTPIEAVIFTEGRECAPSRSRRATKQGVSFIDCNKQAEARWKRSPSQHISSLLLLQIPLFSFCRITWKGRSWKMLVAGRSSLTLFFSCYLFLPLCWD